MKHTRVPQIIAQERTRILEKWSYWIVRELASTRDFRLEAEWIAERLGQKISIAEAQEAIDLLLELKFVVLGPDGHYGPGEALVSSSDEKTCQLVQGLHRQLIELSLHSLARDPVAEREFGAVTVALSKSKLPKAKELMKRFRREFHQLMSEDDALGEEVYQLNLAFFPLSIPVKRKSK
jgi:uncharacterized protein (TIGR02147 family)